MYNTMYYFEKVYSPPSAQPIVKTAIANKQVGT